MNNNQKLDFVCIGAQKAGTTALHNYLLEHPQIMLPHTDKESPFFCYEKNNPDSFNFRKVFQNSDNKNKIYGKITPQYMSYVGSASYIYKYNPNIKIIILLREPIPRLVSHYKMCVKRKYISDNINDFIDDYRLKKRIITNSSFSKKENIKEEEINGIISWGGYGNILPYYLNLFAKEQILIIRSKDLNFKTKDTLDSIYHFLGIDSIFPHNIKKKYHVGGDKMILPSIQTISDSLVGKILKVIIPSAIRRRFLTPNIRLWYSDFFSTNSKNDYNLSRENYKYLNDLYNSINKKYIFEEKLE